jgi:hypothetical protein
MPNPYKYLYNTNGRAVCRSALIAADAGTWLPTDESTPADHILDGRVWEKVQICPEFNVAPGGTGTITVQLLKAVPTATGRQWIAETAVAIPVGESADFVVDGHLVAFRVTAVTLGTAASVSVIATGGAWLQSRG